MQLREYLRKKNHIQAGTILGKREEILGICMHKKYFCIRQYKHKKIFNIKVA